MSILIFEYNTKTLMPFFSNVNWKRLNCGSTKELIYFYKKQRESCMPDEASQKAVTPLLSVVLATKGNKTVLLERCIKSLQNQTFQQFEVILVYSIYPAALSKLFEDYNILTLKESGRTLGAARNLGVKNAKADIVVFIDDDAEAPVDWLSKIYSTFQEYPKLMCLGGAQLTPNDESKSNPLRFVEGSFLESQLGETVIIDRSAVGKIAGCNVAYRKMIFDKIGPLNEKLRSGEDWEFHIRLVENGCNLRCDPSISVWHHRQGLTHAFWNSSNMVSFFLSWKTLKYSRYEFLFASYYLSNFLFLVLLVTVFVSPIVFILLLALILLGHFTFTAIRTKVHDRRIFYYPLIVLFTLARILGFYFGIFKRVASKLHR
jgi:glycosyltransferase involved in cell wall biosynthesis